MCSEGNSKDARECDLQDHPHRVACKLFYGTVYVVREQVKQASRQVVCIAKTEKSVSKVAPSVAETVPQRTSKNGAKITTSVISQHLFDADYNQLYYYSS